MSEFCFLQDIYTISDDIFLLPTLLHRKFKINADVKKINEDIYLIDNELNRECSILQNLFIRDIVNMLNIYNPIYCSAKFYKNWREEEFIVVPIGDFEAYQSNLILDLQNIDFSFEDNSFLCHLKKIDSLLAFQIEKEIKKFNDNRGCFRNLYESLNSDIRDKFIKTIFSTYRSLKKNQIYHDNEILLFCNKYLLISYSSLSSVKNYNEFLFQ